MFLSELFRSKRAVCSFEIFPPKPTADIATVRGTIEELSALKPDYISVTCSAGGSGNARTPQIAQLVKSCGVEPLAHLTCIHSSRADIDAALDELQQLGIENILALRGDRIAGAAESTVFAHASDLAAHISARGGFDIAGACYPEGHPESASLAEDVRNLKKKVDAGVTHLNTQLFFDNEDFYRFRDLLAAAGIDVPKIPAKISRSIARFYDKPEALMEAGIAYAVDQIVDLLASGAQGIHLYVMNNPDVARRITESIAGVVAEVNRAG